MLAAALIASPAEALRPPGVAYDIAVTLDTQRHQLDGWATIGYRSGADSTLHALWLHAYPNAFSSERTIYGREAERYGEDYQVRFAPARDRGWMTIDSATVAGAPARVVVDETLARLDLPRPLEPGDSTTFRVHFRVGIPRVFDRFGHTGTNYSIAQWYPKMVVYDEHGWARDPYHFFAEFYGEFATYDVAITLPDEQWVGATGVLTAVSGGDNEIPLQDPSRDSVAVRFRTVVADSLAGRWPSGSLRLEPLEEEGTPLTVPRDSAVVWRVPVGAPVHYRWAWADSAGEGPLLERDADGRRGPVRLLTARRDTSLTDTLRALAEARGDGAQAHGQDAKRDGAGKGSAPPDSSASSLKTLHYRAERVHDFAFVTSPDYVRADTTWNGIAVRTLIYRDDAPDWKRALEYTIKAFEHHTALIGPYIWPQFTCAESFTAGGAMEYPMLIMNDPDFPGGHDEVIDATIAHEVGHNWFYGMIGNDERRHPWLDEGFTQYLEDRYMRLHYPRGTWRHRDRARWAAQAHWHHRDETAFIARHLARDEVPVASSADGCRSYPQYGTMAYGRPEEMLRTFERVVGEEKMRAFLGAVYRRGVGRHIRPEDVTAAARDATGADYSDYFRQWTETTAVPNFALGGVRRDASAAGGRATVTVLRRGEISFPVPIEARYADGTTETKLVSTPHARNEVVFEGGSRIAGVTLDPQREIFDADRLDDQGSLLPPMRVRPLLDVATPNAISVVFGPTVWHGRAEGARLGGWMEGRFLPSTDFPRGIRSLEGGLNVGTRDGSVAWRAGFARRVGALGARGSLRALAARDAGLFRAEFTASNWITESGLRHPWCTWGLEAQWLDRDPDALLGGDDSRVDPAYWSPGRTLHVGASLRIETMGPRRRETIAIAGGHGFDPDGGAAGARYERVSLEARQTLDLGATARYHIDTRFYGGLAWRRAPKERLFDAVQATRLETLDRFYANDRGPLRESDHYWTGGGGGLRGYVGRTVLNRRIGALSLEAHHDRWPIVLFGDAARLKAGAPFDRVVADAGIGFRYRGVRLDAPFWISTPKSGENPFDARWVVSFDLPELRWH